MDPISLESLNNETEAEFLAALGEVCEHAPWVAEAAASARPFPSLASLYAAFEVAIRAAPAERRLALLRNHPDLAGKAARAGTLTPDSAREQSSAGLDRLSEAEYATFHSLNDAYKAKFGIPFIVCVRRHSKDSILAEFERRVASAPQAELDAAVTEVLRIIALRLNQRVASRDRLKVHGRLSTHVLDTHRGRPAAGLALALFELDRSGAPRRLARTKTNADGRTDAPLIAERPVPIGRYELRFEVAAYFRATGVPLADPPFLDCVPVRFAVAEPEGHYHVPLLVTPWTYTTYRGS